MTANIQLDEGQSGKYTETEEVTTNVHRQGMSLRDVKAGALVVSSVARQTVTCISASTDYTITNPLASTTKYVSVYCASPFIVAMGQTTATYGPYLAAGTWMFPVTYTGVAANDRIHAQSPTAGSVVYVTELA